MKDIAVILAAAGKSTRFGDSFQKKVYSLLNNRAVWLHAADAFLDHPRVGQLILVIDAEDQEYFSEKFAGVAAMMGVEVVHGGAERWQSVQRGIECVRPSCSLIAIHDAARPCLSRVWLDEVFEKADRIGAAILASPIHSTVKRVKAGDTIAETVSRDGLWQAHTPQVFRRELIQRAYADKKVARPTDDAELVEALGVAVAVVECSHLNIKITSRADLKVAELAMKAIPRSKPFPFG